jgi:hypothetical protein
MTTIGITNTVSIRLAKGILTDGSEVFDLYLSQDGQLPIRLDCCSERDAYALLEQLQTSIHDHTVNDTKVA